MHNSTLTRVFRIATAVAVVISSCRAATAATLQEELHASPSLPWVATFGTHGSDEEFQGSFELLVPLKVYENGVLFLYPEATGSSEADMSYSIGLGFRALLHDPDFIIGANIFYDNGNTQFDNRIDRLGIGAELLSHRFDARINAYFADTDRHLIDERSAVSHSTSSRIVGRSSRVSGPQLGGRSGRGASPQPTGGAFQTVTTTEKIRTTRTTTTRFFEQYEAGMNGWDAEVGFLVPYVDEYVDLRLFAGYFGFDNAFGGDIEGFKARAELRLNDYVTLDAHYFEDQRLTGSNWFFGGRVSIPIGGVTEAAEESGHSSPLMRRLTENIIRDARARTSVSDFIENPARRKVVRRSFTTTRRSVRHVPVDLVIDQDIIFVDSDNAEMGDGSLENPFQSIDLAQMEAARRADEGEGAQTIYVFDSDSNYLESVAFDGTNIDNFSVSLLDSSNPINFNGLPLGGGGKADWTAPTEQVPLQLTNLDEFNLAGFAITSDGADAFVANNVNRLNMNNTMFNATNGAALNLTGVTEVQGSGLFATSSGRTSGIVIENSGGDTPSNLRFQSADIRPAPPVFGGISLRNNTGIFNIVGTDAPVTVTGNEFAIYAEGGDAAYTFDRLAVVDSSGGINLVNTNGSFTFANTTVTNAQTALWLQGGSTNAHVLASSSFGGTVFVNNHTGDLLFEGSLTSTFRPIFWNADGNYTFNGAVTLNAANAGIEIADGSDGTFLFGPNTSITTGGTGFLGQMSSPNVTYRGTIASNGGRLLNLENVGGEFRFVDGSLENTNGSGIVVIGSSAGITVENARILNSLISGTQLNGNNGVFRLVNSTIDGSDDIGLGFASGNGVVDIVDSTISNNSTIVDGAGIAHLAAGTTNVINSTISGNHAPRAGGIAVLNGTVNISNSTITDNTADASDGGGIFRSGGTVNITSSIVAGNTAGGTGNDISGAVNADFSLVGDTSGATINGANNILNQSPLLQALADNGGDTLTHALDPNSPAINAGSNPLNLVSDQRGRNRSIGGATDIGAFEILLPGMVDGMDEMFGNIIGNVFFEVTDPAMGLFANDDGFDDFSFNPTTALGGDFTLNADGTFAYNPPAGVTDTVDQITYTLTDTNSGATDTATAFFTISDLVWFVDNTAPSGGDGRQISPFDALEDVSNLADPDGPGDAIFIRQGSGPYDGAPFGLALEDNQRLFGQGAPLVIQGQTVETGSPAQTPTITNSGTGAGILLAQDNLVRALNIDNAAVGIFANGVQNTTIEQVSITNSRDVGFGTSGNLAAGTYTFNDVDIINADGTLLSVTLDNSTMTFDGASRLEQNNDGSVLAADGFHSGTINFLPGSTIAATNGDGLQFDSARGTYNFQGTMTLDGGDAGIDIFNNASGTFNFGSDTTINHAFPGLAAVDINGLLTGFEGTFNYDGSIATNGSAPISIAETSPGSIINFNNSGANAITSTGSPDPGGLGEGITIFNADGTVNINTPTTLTDANFGITVDIDSAGMVTFTDTTINVTDPGTSAIPVVVGDHPGTIRFTNLNISTNGNQEHAFFVGNTDLSVGTLIVDGDSNITTNGDGAIRLKNIDNIDVTFNNVSATNPTSLPNAMPPSAPIAGIDVENVGTGTFRATNLTTENARNALAISGSGADFTFEDITATNSTEQGVKIENYTGTFLLSEGDDNVDDDILTIDGTGDGFAGIDISNSGTATFTFANTDIRNTGAEGALLDDAGTVRFSGRSGMVGDEIGNTLISSTNGDAIHSTNTNLVVTFARIGETGQIMGDGIEIINNDGQTRTADLIFNNVFGLGVPDPTGRGVFINAQSGTLLANLNANFFATEMTTISTVDGGAANSLILDLTGNSTLSTFSPQPVMSIVGNGLHSTIVRAWDFPNQVIGGITGSSGILFDRVTFDADGNPGNGIQQVVFSDDLDIGQVPPFTIQRVEGDGLTFINPTGDLRIDVLNIANQNGTGLIIDTKGLGTTFNLDVGGGTIDTINGAAMNLDPLTGTLVFDVVDVDGSPTNGILVDVFDGMLTVNDGTIRNTTGSAVMLIDADAVVLNGMTLDASSSGDARAAAAVNATNNSRLTLNDVTINGGNSGDGANMAVGNGEDGFDGGDGVRADGSSTVDVIDSTIRAGNGGDGGDGAMDAEGGNGGRGGNAVSAAGGSTINVMSSQLNGGDSGLAGTPAGIFGGVNGAAGSGAFAEGGSTVNISDNTTIQGGNAIRSDINFVSGAVDAIDSTIDIRNSMITGGNSQEGIHTTNGVLSLTNTNSTGGTAAGAAIFANNTDITIDGGTFTGGFGPVLGDSAFPGGFGLQIRGASTLDVTGAAIRGGDGPAEEALGSMGGSGGVAFAFEVTDPGAMGTFRNTTMTGGNGGLGGGGFNGSGGEGAFVGADAVVDFINAEIVGGIGSDGAAGGNQPGSNGGEGLIVSGGTVTIDANTTVTGGLGGNGDSGQEGGIGGEGTFVTSNGGLLTINGSTINGGNGGVGGANADGGDGGHGVRVGFAVTENLPGATTVNAANVTGGNGGNGGNNGSGGDGGAGARVFENGTVNLNNSNITGGDGGNGTAGGTGGNGGMGADNTPPVAFDPGTINNNGSTLTDGTDGTP